MPSTHSRPASPAAAPISRTQRRSPWPWILVAVLLIVAGLGVAWSLGLLGPQGLTVPDVTGMQVAEAEQKLREAGFTLGEVTESFSKDVPAGEVIDQSPIANARAKKNTPVALTVSKGARMVDVPKIVGLSEDEALRVIRDAGFVAEALPDDYSTDYEAGVVAKQSPESGEEAAEGSPIQFVVSKGKRLVVVPDVRGKSLNSAKKTLTDAGLKVSTTEAFDENVAAGKIISQNPLPDIEVAEGSTISLVVSKGSELVTVPDVIGATEEEAVATLESAGLDVKRTYEPHSENGIVLTQSPKGGVKVKRGSTVTILIDAVQP